MDDACLSRVLDLLEFFRREAKAAAAAQSQTGGRPGTAREASPAADDSDWAPMTESRADRDFALAAHEYVPAGVLGMVDKIPENLRDMIRWAEDQKKKMGLS